METPTEKVCPHCKLPPVLPEVCTPEINAVLEANIARDTELHNHGYELGKRMAGDAHPTPPPAALAPERWEHCHHQYWDLGYCIDCGISANDPRYGQQLRDRNIAPPPARAEVPTSPEMGHGWRVEVSRFGEQVVAIEERLLTGRDLSDEDRDLIRGCAQHLLSFVGEPEPARAEATEGAEAERWRLAGERVGVVYGCDTPDWMAETILGLRADNARLTQALEQAQREIASLKEMLDTESEDATQWRREEAKERTRAEQAEAERDQQGRGAREAARGAGQWRWRMRTTPRM